MQGNSLGQLCRHPGGVLLAQLAHHNDFRIRHLDGSGVEDILRGGVGAYAPFSLGRVQVFLRGSEETAKGFGVESPKGFGIVTILNCFHAVDQDQADDDQRGSQPDTMRQPHGIT